MVWLWWFGGMASKVDGQWWCERLSGSVSFLRCHQSAAQRKYNVKSSVMISVKKPKSTSWYCSRHNIYFHFTYTIELFYNTHKGSEERCTSTNEFEVNILPLNQESSFPCSFLYLEPYLLLPLHSLRCSWFLFLLINTLGVDHSSLLMVQQNNNAILLSL
jgi:hypothetical protein